MYHLCFFLISQLGILALSLIRIIRPFMISCLMNLEKSTIILEGWIKRVVDWSCCVQIRRWYMILNTLVKKSLKNTSYSSISPLIESWNLVFFPESTMSELFSELSKSTLNPPEKSELFSTKVRKGTLGVFSRF